MMIRSFCRRTLAIGATLFAAGCASLSPVTGPAAPGPALEPGPTAELAPLGATVLAASSESVSALLPEPEAEVLEVLTGVASYYANTLAGRRTASGERYDPASLVAAHRHLPFGTLLRVTNPANGRSVEVRVIDRGPFTQGRVLDLSRSAAETLGIIRRGIAPVRIEVLSYGG